MEIEKGRAVIRSYLQQRHQVSEIELQIRKILNAYITTERSPYPRSALKGFHCHSYDLPDGGDSLRVKGWWSRSYTADDRENAVIEVPVEVLAPLANPTE